MNISKITPVILTWNEGANIGRCLENLRWADQIVVVDSGSTDNTLEIVARYPNAQVVHRPFDNHIDQWNFGIRQAGTEWVLSLDADYMLTTDWLEELRKLNERDSDAIFASFRYVVAGKVLRGTLYPPRAVLFRADRCRYECDGHTQLLVFPGKCEKMRSPLLHDDRKTFDRWYQSQIKYAGLERDKLLGGNVRLSWKDRIRLCIVFAPCLTFFYCMFGKGLVLDGTAGVAYAFQRVFAELLLSLMLLEAKIKRRQCTDGHCC